MVPAASSWTISALPQSTRQTALRKPTVVSGSYVTLSNSTRRTAPPAGVGRLSEPHAPSVSPGTRIRHHLSVQVAGDHRVRDMSELTGAAPTGLHWSPPGPTPGATEERRGKEAP